MVRDHAVHKETLHTDTVGVKPLSIITGEENHICKRTTLGVRENHFTGRNLYTILEIRILIAFGYKKVLITTV